MDGKKKPRDFPRWNRMVDMIKRQRAGAGGEEHERKPKQSKIEGRAGV